MASEEIAKRLHISKIKAFEHFIKSKTADMLFDDTCLMWHNGPAYIADEYFLEKRAKRYILSEKKCID